MKDLSWCKVVAILKNHAEIARLNLWYEERQQVRGDFERIASRMNERWKLGLRTCPLETKVWLFIVNEIYANTKIDVKLSRYPCRVILSFRSFLYSTRTFIHAIRKRKKRKSHPDWVQISCNIFMRDIALSFSKSYVTEQRYPQVYSYFLY